MNKILFLCFMLFIAFTGICQDSLKTPEFPRNQLHIGAINLLNSTVINAISVSKESGMTVTQFAGKMADLWQQGWSKDLVFEEYINSGIWLLSCRTGFSDKQLTILIFNDSMAKLKFHKNYTPWFANGPIHGVTEQEFTNFWYTVEQQIADYLGFEMSVEDIGEHLLFTLHDRK